MNRRTHAKAIPFPRAKLTALLALSVLSLLAIAFAAPSTNATPGNQITVNRDTPPLQKQATSGSYRGQGPRNGGYYAAPPLVYSAPNIHYYYAPPLVYTPGFTFGLAGATIQDH